MTEYTEFKKALQKLSKSMEKDCEDVALVKSTIQGINSMVDGLIRIAKCRQGKPTCPPGKLLNPKTGRCIQDTLANRKKLGLQKSPKSCPPGKTVNPKTGRCITKPKSKTQKKNTSKQVTKKTEKVDNLKTQPISKYYQKQYEKYMKPSSKADIQDAFFEEVKEKPKKKHTYNLRR